MSVEMRAVKPLKYRTRHLVPGENFRVKNSREAKVLTHLKKAECTGNADAKVALDDARAKVGMAPISPASESIAELRERYAEAYQGKRPFNGWSTAQLKAKIAEAPAAAADEDNEDE